MMAYTLRFRRIFNPPVTDVIPGAGNSTCRKGVAGSVLAGLVVFFLMMALPAAPVCSAAEPVNGNSLLKEARAVLSAGNHDAALKLLEKASDIHAFRSVNLYFNCVNTLGKLYYESGKVEKGLNLYRKAGENAWKLSDMKAYINFHSLYGMFLASAGMCDKAQVYHQKAVTEAGLIKEPVVLSYVLANRALSFSECGDHEASLDTFQKSFNASEKDTPEPEGALYQALMLINIAKEALKTGNTDTSAGALIKAAGYVPELADTEAVAVSVAIASLAEPLLADKETMQGTRLKQGVHRLLRRADGIAEKSGSIRAQAEIAGIYGRYYLAENRLKNALSSTRKALFLASQKNLPRTQYTLYWQLARIFQAAGNGEKAMSSYRKAIDIVDPIRSDLLDMMQDDDTFFAEKIKPVYSGYAELLIGKAETTTAGAEKEKLLLHARAVMDQLKSYELQDYFGDECIVCPDDKPDAISRGVPEGTAVYYPIIFRESLVVILSLPSGTTHVRVPVDEKTLTKNVKRFRKRLQSIPGKRYRFYSKQLYTQLIEPVDTLLKKASVDTLVVVPEGVLRLIPFSAFNNGRHYLAETYATSIVPTVSSVSRRGSGLAGGKVLICGLSQNSTGNTSLPGVPDELFRLRDLTGGNVLLNTTFTAETLKAELKKRDYSIIHMATHGYFGGKGGGSLETFNGEITLESLETLLSIGRFRKTKVELLTLSACDSGVGDERAAMGLGGVALKAGVKSALATLWYINDKAAADVVLRFYSHALTPGVTKAHALRKTHVEMIQSETYSHPAYWAPFLLIGSSMP